MTTPSRFSLRGRLGLRYVSWLLLLLLTGLGLPARAQNLMTPEQQQKREWYREAQAALQRNDRAAFVDLRSRLLDYPLLSYLDHAELTPRLDSLPADEVHAFLDANAGTVVARRLERQWQQKLADSGQWQQLITDFNPGNASTELRCQVLRARLDAGDRSALDEVDALWNVARSQPNVCDPLFAVWRAEGRLTPALGWDRFRKSIQATELNLARYVITLLPPREQRLASLWLDTVQQPRRLREQASYQLDEPEMNEILLHSLRRLAQNNAELAWELTGPYAAKRQFSAEDHLALQRYVLLRLLLQGQVSQVETLLRNDPALPSDSLVEWLLRDALNQQDWQRFDSWLAYLSSEAIASERWRYWRARSLARHDTGETDAAAQALFEELAGSRSFYGFLAADRLQRNYALVDRPVQASAADMEAVLMRPALARAIELYLVDDESNALREWDHALSAMTEKEVLAAGKLANQLGWHRNGIQASIQVSYWDDLDLRFPLAYRELVGLEAGRHSGLHSTFVYAIARQESAFISNARSSAGAMGLMQLMPGTARETAASAGMQLKGNQELYKPETNIALGSRYLHGMLQRFGGNRILAAAAYNAGPNRVRGWLAQDPALRRPFDIWIETIPFAETRNYVQNVLAYSVIYGYRMNESVSMLTPEEMETLL